MGARGSGRAGRRAALAVLAVLGTAVALGGCKGPWDGGELPPPPATVKVREATAVIKHGAIGVKDRQDGSYVLVEAENGSAEARNVSLEGELLDERGQSLTRLYVDELRVPAGEHRTFALVAAGSFPGARTARLRVRAAPVSKDDAIAIVKELETGRQATGFVADATIENKLTRQALATIIVTFYDKDGKILTRPFAPVQLLPRSTRSFSFTGPLEATRAEAFIGDAAF